ncbi:glycine-rich cell wall structural protein-like [Juglans microcarpa x Juglans regia]|uniref:glycine-rich cell wall structural protein-like n=1 Tax=Juglans microcarpa x Juglans regia TaxID=2249226 RepID=UPI001B7E8EE3|nr:glycine-rich cell wall structural protein-like [Juglans microcarpa x Juglans regia]
MTNTPTTATPTKVTELTFDPGGGLEPLLEFDLAVFVLEEGGEGLCPTEVGGGGGDDSALVRGESSVGGDGLDFWGGEVGREGEEMAIGEETRGDRGGGACIADGVFSVAGGGGGGESGNDFSGDGGVDCLLGLGGGGGDDGGWGGGGGEALEFDGGGGAFESPDSNGGEGY